MKKVVKQGGYKAGKEYACKYFIFNLNMEQRHYRPDGTNGTDNTYLTSAFGAEGTKSRADQISHKLPTTWPPPLQPRCVGPGAKISPEVSEIDKSCCTAKS